MRTRDLMKQEKGSTVVELSLVVMVFFILIVGLMDVGRAVWASNTITAVARDATRHAIVHGDRSPAPADASDIQDYVTGRLPGLSGVTVSTVWDPDNSQGSMVTVTVQYPYQPIIALFAPVTLSATSEMAISY